MTSVLLVIAAIIAVLSCLSLVAAWRGAVVGQEDENGFHVVPAKVTAAPVARRRLLRARQPQAA